MSRKNVKHGRIGRLDEQTLGYYRRVEQALNDGFDEDSDQKELFIQNVFNTLHTEAMLVSQNQTASNIVEHLLREASLKHLISFGQALSKDWELACTDRFVSHVTQTYTSQLGLRISENNHHKDGFSILTELYSFLMSNLAYHMQHTYASHIVRVMIETLGGVKCSDCIVRSRVARQSKGPNVKEASAIASPSKHFTSLLNEICDKIVHLDRIKDHVKNYLSNPVLQTLLLVLDKADPERCKSVCQYFVQEADIFKNEKTDANNEEEISLPELVQHEIGSHFVEQVIQTVGGELFDVILDSLLQDKLLAMAIHPTANFVLQKLIKCCHSSEQFEAIFKVLRKHLESILCLNHSQVIVCLAESCNKFGTKQEKLTKALMKTFHCYKPEERQSKCVPLFASLTAYEVFYKMPSDDEQDSDSDEEKEIKYPELTAVNIHGSLLLQQLLRFGNPKLVVTSLLNLKPSELRTMSCDPCGSHIVETFFTSQTIGEKSRDAFYLRMKSLYSDLACNKNGSRTLDTMFNTAPIRHKFTIAEEMIRHESKIRGDRFGRILWWNYNLNAFQRNKNEWKQRQLTEMKKRKLFQELISETPPHKPKNLKPIEQNLQKKETKAN